MIGKLYERHVLPKVLDACCSTKPVNYQRNKIVPHAKGKILEIGPSLKERFGGYASRISIGLPSDVKDYNDVGDLLSYLHK